MLHDWNPVGLVSVGLASVLSLLAFAGLLGAALKPFSVLIAIGVAFVATPVMALATRGRYYLRRHSDGIDSPLFDEHGNPSGERFRCHVTGYMFERPDMLASAQRGLHGQVQYVSSLALTLDDSDRYVLPPDVIGPAHWATDRGRGERDGGAGRHRDRDSGERGDSAA
jgi:hypothetical protein